MERAGRLYFCPVSLKPTFVAQSGRFRVEVGPGVNADGEPSLSGGIHRYFVDNNEVTKEEYIALTEIARAQRAGGKPS